MVELPLWLALALSFLAGFGLGSLLYRLLKVGGEGECIQQIKKNY